MPAHIDTLALAKVIQEAGFTPSMSDGLARAMQDIAMKDVPSQADVREAVHQLTVRMGAAAVFIVTVLGVLITLN